MQPNIGTPRSFLPVWLAGSVAAAAFAGGGIGGYAIYAHRAAQNAQVQQERVTSELNQARTQIDELTSKVNMLTARTEQQPAVVTATPEETPVAQPTPRAKVAAKRPADSQQMKKMQAQLDRQDQAIAATRSQLESTQGDLSTTRTELSGSIARNHDELVLLQKKGERNYYEFDIAKSKTFQREGPMSVRLRKANIKHQYADLDLIVEDRNLSQKHVNLYQPAMFLMPDSPQPAELVINNIGQDHIHGYVSSPKFRKSELASIPNTNSPGTNQPSDAKSGSQPGQRQTLPQPQ